ncbi:hypothetical protein CC78DRAFT_573145 [Lojkania enalia]|uniref:Uncharacterized protein n=1 Tax=Lojkania enalia TaxID=147567 RepID=A0A9P4NCN2_9PLEO|nr:hypothetical protein CC78DRAFT_573145 [Didymosphaeria enalia]
MNLRFDHVAFDTELEDQEVEGGYWQWGTIAYVDIEDVLLAWENTEEKGQAHPLRNFYRDWLKRYWDAYQISDWDHKSLDDIEEIIQKCPDLAASCMRGLMARKEDRRQHCIKAIGEYWVPTVEETITEYVLSRRELGELDFEELHQFRKARYLDVPHRKYSVSLEPPSSNWERV